MECIPWAGLHCLQYVGGDEKSLWRPHYSHPFRPRQDLLGGLYGNPHSSYGWAQHVSEAAEARVRQLTLALCRADPQQYECVLTSGATGELSI